MRMETTSILIDHALCCPAVSILAPFGVIHQLERSTCRAPCREKMMGWKQRVCESITSNAAMKTERVEEVRTRQLKSSTTRHDLNRQRVDNLWKRGSIDTENIG